MGALANDDIKNVTASDGNREDVYDTHNDLLLPLVIEAIERYQMMEESCERAQGRKRIEAERLLLHASYNLGQWIKSHESDAVNHRGFNTEDVVEKTKNVLRTHIYRSYDNLEKQVDHIRRTSLRLYGNFSNITHRADPILEMCLRCSLAFGDVCKMTETDFKDYFLGIL